MVVTMSNACNVMHNSGVHYNFVICVLSIQNSNFCARIVRALFNDSQALEYGHLQENDRRLRVKERLIPHERHCVFVCTSVSMYVYIGNFAQTIAKACQDQLFAIVLIEF